MYLKDYRIKKITGEDVIKRMKTSNKYNFISAGGVAL